LLGISRIDKAREAGAIQAARIAATPAARPSLHSSQRTGRNGQPAPSNGHAPRSQHLETDCVDVTPFMPA
jgi:hypothetical protein